MFSIIQSSLLQLLRSCSTAYNGAFRNCATFMIRFVTFCLCFAFQFDSCYKNVTFAAFRFAIGTILSNSLPF